MLWIAFRIQYLWYQQQQIGVLGLIGNRCELLSEFSIFDTNNNRMAGVKLQWIVVNCFQNSVSLIPTTTKYRSNSCNKRLWIAFRIQYLWYQQQPVNPISGATGRCELLSEFSIFDTNNNTKSTWGVERIVVNCFQNSVSLIPTTTWKCHSILPTLLWIAFRIQYLWYQQQPVLTSDVLRVGCELLSEFSIFDTNNNQCNDFRIRINVVNCFQNSVSLIPTTTMNYKYTSLFLLWIAFRIQYLWYQQQQMPRQPYQD